MGLRYSDGQSVVSPEGVRWKQQEDISRPAEATGKQERARFWQLLRDSSVDAKLQEGSRYEVALHCHPRIENAVKIIEGLLTDAACDDYKSKVLVFCAFNAPLLALTQALNIRAFLRDLENDVPTLLPAPLVPSDVEVIYWASELEMLLDKGKIERLGRAYESARDRLRETCKQLVQSWLSGRFGDAGASVTSATRAMIVDWLVFNLPLSSLSNRTQLSEDAERSLSTLFDVDPPEDASAESVDVDRPDGYKPARMNVAQSSIDESSICESIREDMPVGGSPRSAFARAMYGDVKPKTRRTLQFRFNQKEMNPQVLVAQAAVASEGLNLHEACRKVVLFHLDWNPAKIEQQIGRVDRQNSLWMKQFELWMDSQHPSGSAPPQIEIHTISLEGTYDDHRSKVIVERQMMMRAQIFGELVPSETLASLPQTLQDRIRDAAPDFSPS